MRHARILLRPIFALTLVAAWSATSFAQTPAPPSAPENAKPEAAPTPGDKSSGVPLSKKLDENEGKAGKIVRAGDGRPTTSILK